MQPFVLRLDVSRRVAPEDVLKGAEIDNRLVVVDFGGIAVGTSGATGKSVAA
jgi:hypothetical protein